VKGRRLFLLCALLVAAAGVLPLVLPLFVSSVPSAPPPGGEQGDDGPTGAVAVAGAPSLDRIERGPLAVVSSLPPAGSVALAASSTRRDLARLPGAPAAGAPRPSDVARRL
jgi:hypothetical protein